MSQARRTTMDACQELSRDYANGRNVSTHTFTPASTVGELRRLLERLPDTLPVAGLENLYNDEPIVTTPLSYAQVEVSTTGHAALVLGFVDLDELDLEGLTKEDED